jgi:serine/threonine protein kinase
MDVPSWRPSAQLTPMETYARFEILGRVGRGGMAEILLARERNLAGTTRHLVIKRILPEAADSDEMLHMFLDEARVVMGLSHPNLCQIFDVGEQDGTWFIAMEWVHGVTLHQLLRKALTDGMDYAVMARIFSQCAEALHHAHCARDSAGQPLNLVHRDVSPHNIMVAYDGRVKLLDFGIAKSAVSTHHTEAGVVKGKVCYMAPEQWMSGPLDGRTDVFALGACLYETLTGRVVFKRDSQIEVMRAAMNADVPPLSELVPNIPAELERIVYRALAVNADDRFGSALEMSEALEDFIAANHGALGAAQVAEYARRLFPSEVLNGPTLERSLYGSEMAPPPMLLPPVPSGLIGPPKPLPRSLTIPPPAFLMPQKPTAAPPHGAAGWQARHQFSAGADAGQRDDVFDAEVTSPLDALADSGDDTLIEERERFATERELDRIADMTAERADEEDPTRDLPYKPPATFSDVPTRPHTIEGVGGLRPLDSQRPIDTQRLRDDTKKVVTMSSAPRPLARTLSIPVTESVRRIVVVALPAAAASLIAVYATLSLRHDEPRARINPTPAQQAQPAPRPAAVKRISVDAPIAAIPVRVPEAASHEKAVVETRGSLRPQLGEGEGFLSLDTRPWSTVYLGKQLLGTTPLIGVVVPKRALLLRLVDSQGHEHMRGIAASDDETRRAFFDFEPSPRQPRDANPGPAPAEAAENAEAADKAGAGQAPEAPAKAEPEPEPDIGPAIVPTNGAGELPMRDVPVAIDRLAPGDNDTAY